MQANFDEARQSQLPLVELLINMGYQYIPREEVARQRNGDNTRFLLRDITFAKLKEINNFEYQGEQRQFSDANIYKAIDELENIKLDGLLDTSKDVYNIMMSMSGKTITEFIDGKSQSFDFAFIDHKNPANNAFHVAVEYEATGRSTCRTDIVCFANGIPFVAIENKKSSIDISEALTQLNRNQLPEYCPRFFLFPQILIGTNGKELRYATTRTPNKFYATWREKGISPEQVEEQVQQLIHKPIDAALYKQICADLNGATLGHKQITERLTTEQDRGAYCLLRPERLLELTKHYILYDAGIKKVARYQQFFAIHKMFHRIEQETEGIGGTKRQGGIVWHTQGSGKSLTMVMFVKALIENPRILNPRIIIVTDRTDLDKQIATTFRSCNLKKKVEVAKTGRHLLDMIKSKETAVITTLVNKFNSASSHRAGFQDTDKDIFVLIDEAHRTQGGIANAEMARTIPNACFIAFTGTPLLKKDKSKLKFGKFIDKYTIDDALADGVVLPLIYEGRYVEMTQNKTKIDQQVERITQGFTDEQKKELQRYVNSKVIKGNPQRIAEIAFDVEQHFVQNFQGTGLKAQVVAPSKYSAILFQRIFEESGKLKTAVVLSAEQTKEEDVDSHKKEVLEFMKGIKDDYSSIDSYDQNIIESFKHDPDGVEIIIVVDKLLTGFDAPRNTVLYLCKDLKDHNLLQAIARVNRLHENKKKPKTSGYIIDYSENAKNLHQAMELFGNYDQEDVENSLIDVLQKIDELDTTHNSIESLFQNVQNKQDDEEYIRELDDPQKREKFYHLVSQFLRNFDECLSLPDFANKFPRLDEYRIDLKRYMELRRTKKLHSAEDRDISEYKEQITRILDKYVDASEVDILTGQVNINDNDSFAKALEELGSDKSKAEAIGAQTQRTIAEKEKTDPEFYRRFSDKIQDILQKLREGKIADLKALELLKEMREQVTSKCDADIPGQIAEEQGADILYRNLLPQIEDIGLDQSAAIDVVLGIMKILHTEVVVDWQKNEEVKRVIFNKLDDYLYDELKHNLKINFEYDQLQALAEHALQLAEENHDIFHG